MRSEILHGIKPSVCRRRCRGLLVAKKTIATYSIVRTMTHKKLPRNRNCLIAFRLILSIALRSFSTQMYKPTETDRTNDALLPTKKQGHHIRQDLSPWSQWIAVLLVVSRNILLISQSARACFRTRLWRLLRISCPGIIVFALLIPS